MTTRHYNIKGRVQGVGFRWYTRQEALALGLSGWTRNRADGSVEVLVDGPDDAVSAFEQSLGNGPPAARVDGVETDASEEDKTPLGFEILPTE